MHFDLPQQRPDNSQANESTSSFSKLLDPHRNSALKAKKTLKDYKFVANENCQLGSSDLGRGAYGMVKKVKDIESGEIYAMKIMDKKSICAYSTKKNLKREISIQKKALHSHIIRLYSCFEDNDSVYLVLEFAENGSLFQYLRGRKSLGENEAFVFFFQTCLGIDYLHKKNVIHRDLKPENLLLDSEGNIKLCDFGWSIDTQGNKDAFCGTIDYMAPEIIKDQHHDYRVDIWCLGILLYEMLHGCAPFKGKSDYEKTKNISSSASIEFSRDLSHEVVDLMKSILKPKPEDRLSLLSIFSHPWMKRHERMFNIDLMTFLAPKKEKKSPKKETHRSPKRNKENAADQEQLHKSFGVDIKSKLDVNPLSNLQDNLSYSTQFDVNKPFLDNSLLYSGEKSMIQGYWSEKKQETGYSDLITSKFEPITYSATKAVETSHFSLDHKSFLQDVSEMSRRIDSCLDQGFGRETSQNNYYSHNNSYLNNNKHTVNYESRNTIEEESLDQFMGRIGLLSQTTLEKDSSFHQLPSSYGHTRQNLPYTNPFFAPNQDAFIERQLEKTEFRNQKIEIARTKSAKESSKEEPGFFKELLMGLGCISKRNAVEGRKGKKVKKESPF